MNGSLRLSRFDSKEETSTMAGIVCDRQSVGSFNFAHICATIFQYWIVIRNLSFDTGKFLRLFQLLSKQDRLKSRCLRIVSRLYSASHEIMVCSDESVPLAADCFVPPSNWHRDNFWHIFTWHSVLSELLFGKDFSWSSNFVRFAF